jgi:hypothetical protein
MTRANSIKVEFMPSIKWKVRAKWKLLEEYTSHNGVVKVPVGFVTDGASVPRIFQYWFSPTGKYFGAAIIHDFLLCMNVSWEIANKEFNNELIALNIPYIRRHILVSSVKLWGKMHKLLKLKVKCYNEIK